MSPLLMRCPNGSAAGDARPQAMFFAGATDWHTASKAALLFRDSVNDLARAARHPATIVQGELA